MTSPKALKALVRARMAETGESYTTARRQVLGTPSRADREREPGEDFSRGSDLDDVQHDTPRSTGRPASTGGTRGQGVEGSTGRSKDEWYALLDAWDGTQRTHTQLARWLVREHEVKGFWAQTIAVGYGQARGMRSPGEAPAAPVSVSLDRTIDVPAEDVFHAFVDEWIRSDWLPEVSFRVQAATPAESVRAQWRDQAGAAGVVGVDLQALTPERTRATLTHDGLADADQTARMKTFWQEHLSILKDLLESDLGRIRHGAGTSGEGRRPTGLMPSDGLDHPLGDVSQFLIAVLGRHPQDRERGVCIAAVLGHDHADGLVDRGA
jgi:uncharacterized protein YndB with AHSA1/START domain